MLVSRRPTIGIRRWNGRKVCLAAFIRAIQNRCIDEKMYRSLSEWYDLFKINVQKQISELSAKLRSDSDGF